jgi:formylglycine-generating enzyme required for sulfatase activity
MQRFSVRLRALALAFVVPLVVALSATSNPPCPSDVDGNQVVDFGDVALVLLDFGACPVAPPALTSVSPAFGPTAGGTTITITGTALTNTNAVTVRGNAATSVVVVSDTTVTAITPPGSIGAANVQVTTPGGTATISGGFTYSNTPPPPAWGTVLEQSPNAAVVYDASLRAAIIATGLPWRVRDNGTGIEMVLIPPGTFSMGCSASTSQNCYGAENPPHQVTLTRAFYLGRYEVTQAQWTAQVGSNPSYFRSASSAVPTSQVANRPVEKVSWDDAEPFGSTYGLRLPTEAEWEYAYRAGTVSAFHGWPSNPSGTDNSSQLGNIAWTDANSNAQTRPVGGKAANGFGLHDMCGNVYEWVQDRFDVYSGAAQIDPTGPTSGNTRVMRGGSWSDSGQTASFRASNPTQVRYEFIGFRVARTP